MMIVCVLFPRFELTVAAGDRLELLQAPVALAPAGGLGSRPSERGRTPSGRQARAGGVQRVGECSLAAEAYGIHSGMKLGEALARSPRLTLVAPDPAGVADAWERLLVRLESIGAAVEPERPGLVCFDAQGLLRLHGRGAALGPGAIGSPENRLHGVLEVARRALRAPARFGVAPSRFAAVAAAARARVRRPVVLLGGREEAREFLAAQPVALLRARPALASLPESLERLGIGTLGELAALPSAAIADRFGRTGLLAHELALGGDGALRPRPASEFLRESLELPEAASGPQLELVLGLLIDRLLARRERRGRTLRSVVLSATLVEHGGTWREQVSFREALADPSRMRLALTPRLAMIPAPAEELRLSVERFGPLAADQRPLLEDPAEARAARLRDAIRQTRTGTAGQDAALRVLEIDPGSRFPERRAVLTPFEA